MKENSIVRITRKFSFEAAHVLSNHDGLCKNIHGHSYALYITLIGRVNSEDDNPESGMIMDFSRLKKLIEKNILNDFDHSLLIKKSTNYKTDDLRLCDNARIIELPFQPTCENLVAYFAEIISSILPYNIRLHKVQLNETANSFAEWHAEDN